MPGPKPRGHATGRRPARRCHRAPRHRQALSAADGTAHDDRRTCDASPGRREVASAHRYRRSAGQTQHVRRSHIGERQLGLWSRPARGANRRFGVGSLCATPELSSGDGGRGNRVAGVGSTSSRCAAGTRQGTIGALVCVRDAGITVRASLHRGWSRGKQPERSRIRIAYG